MAANPQALPLSATQPSATTALQAPTPAAVNPRALEALGSRLANMFTRYEQDRRLAELKWARNARQYLGIYDPDLETQMSKDRSRAYPKLTRVKCVSMLSRLMNLLFPADDKNWTLAPSAVPNLSQEDLQQVLNTLMPQPQPGAMPQGQQPVPTNDQIEAAIRKFAGKRADRMELEIEDQLQELGGSRAVNYVALCREVLQSGIQYGCGILSGPFVEEVPMTRWQIANGQLTAVPYTAYRPRFENISIWDYYPDMSAKTIQQMDGQFIRKIMSRHQLVMLKQRTDFMPDQIDKFLMQSPGGNYRRRAYETEVRAMGVQVNTASSEMHKFEALIWEGYVAGRELSDCGANVPEELIDEDVRACVWLMNGIPIKAQIDPWSQLKTDGEMPQYHQFIFEKDESFILGNGLPNIMRDSQMGVCAAVRMVLDNGSVQRNFEVNTQLLRNDQDMSSINPDKIWYRDDDTSTAQYPAIRAVELPMHLEELQNIVRMFEGFADAETFVNAATGGDMQRGPSEPFRTAAGASMLRGDAALPFKDVVRNFDVFTESVINALLVFNRNFNTNPDLRGDFNAIARGATSLIAKEVQGAQMDNLAATLTDDEKRYINSRELLIARLKARDMDTSAIVLDQEACDAADAAAAQQTQQTQQTQQQMVQAQIRELLSSSLKNIAQAGKNSANSEAITANVILDALEKGINPDMLAPPQGAANDPSTGQSSPGSGANPADTQQQPGTGNAGLEAASGESAVAPGPGSPALPAPGLPTGPGPGGSG